jgi:threonine/homoserine/homoserine lactone efflux protein
LNELLAFLLAGLALTGSPGPANLSLAAAGAAFGIRQSLGYMIGVIFGMIGVMAITATGIMGIVLALPGVAPVVTALSVGYFLYLAFRIATAPPLHDDTQQLRRPAFVGGAFLSLVNPKGYAAMAAMFSSFVLVIGHPAFDVATKISVLTAMIALVNIVWVAGGAALTRCFREPRISRAINVSFAVLLLASVAFALRF